MFKRTEFINEVTKQVLSAKNVLYDLDVGVDIGGKEEVLKEDSEIFVVPSSKKLSEAFVVIDNLSTKKTMFYRLWDLYGAPKMSRKALDNFRRPINNDKTMVENKLVAYINQESEHEQECSIFVSRGDVILGKAKEKVAKA
jgi:hypothetical protein